MYRKRDDLSQLIQSLSGGEKRYFVGFSKAFTASGESPLYLQLYQQYENGKSKHQNPVLDLEEKSLSMTKKRLYFNILKSLRLFHQEKSINIIVQNTLSEVEILYNLGLAEQSLFLLKKAHSLATEHEKFGLLLQILEWESRLNVVLDEPTRPHEELVAEEQHVMRQQQQYRFLENLYVKAEALKKKYGFVRGALVGEVQVATINAPGMPTLKGCLSQKATFYFYFIYSLYYWMTLKHDKAMEYSKLMVALGTACLPPGDYINGLLKHITSCVCVGRFEEALQGLAVGTAFIEEERLTQSHGFTGKMFAYKATYELIIYNYMGKRAKLKETIDYVEKQLEHFDKTITFESRHVIVGNLMNAYIGLGQLEKADGIWDSLFNKQSKAIRRDIYADLYLFRLFSLLQGGTYALLPFAAQSAIRYFRKCGDAEKLFEMEYPIAVLLQKERDYERTEVRREVMEQIGAIVETYISKINKSLCFQEHYSRYAIWCNSLLNEKPFYEEAAKWYVGFQAKEKLWRKIKGSEI